MAAFPPPPLRFFPPPPFHLPPPAFPSSYSHFSASMAIIIVVLVSAFFIMGFFSVYVKRCATSEYEAQLAHLRDPGRVASSRPEPGLDKAIYEAFAIVDYSELKSYKSAKETTECVVCLCEFEDEEKLRLLPICAHFFHPECIDAWFVNHTTCPLCRCSLGPPAEQLRSSGGFWGSARLSRRSSTNAGVGDAADGQASAPNGNGDVVVTVHDQDAVDLEQLRAFMRAGSLRAQSGRRGASFRTTPPSPVDAVARDSKQDEGLSGAEGVTLPRPGEAELRRSLSKNSQSFRQAARGVELQEYLSGSSVSPAKREANTAPDSTPTGASIERTMSLGRLGSSLRRSRSFGVLGGSQRMTSDEDGEDLLTVLESSQEFAKPSQEFPRIIVDGGGFDPPSLNAGAEDGNMESSAMTVDGREPGLDAHDSPKRSEV